MLIKQFSGKVGIGSVVVIPMVVAALVGLGVAAGHVKVSADHAIVSAIVGVVMWSAAGLATFFVVRLGQVRSVPMHLASVVVLPLIAVITSRVVGWQIHPEGVAKGLGYFAFRDEIARVGPPVGISQWHLAGWWFTLTTWLEIVGGVLAGVLGVAIGASPRFCENCHAWASKTVWQFKLVEPEPLALAEFKSSKAVNELTKISRQPGRRGDRLNIKMRSCTCGGEATINVDHVRRGADDGTETETISQDLDVDASEAIRIFEWAETLDQTMAQKRPKLALRDLAKELSKPASDPSFGPMAIVRSGSMVFSSDNEYTHWLRERMRSAGDFELAEVAVAAQADVNDRASVITALSDWPEPPTWLRNWVREMPDSPTAAMVFGNALVYWAWHARGGDWRPKDFDGFQERLVEADDELNRAARMSPKDPIPWALMIAVAMGTQSEPAERKRLFKESVSRNPGLYATYKAMLQASVTKWGGSDDAALALARQVAAKSPAGSPIAAMLIHAHEERSATLDRAKTMADKDYWMQADVVTDVQLVSGRCFPPQMPRWTLAHDTILVPISSALKRCGLKEEAKRLERLWADRYPKKR